MLGAIIKLVPTLRWPPFLPADNAGREQIAIDTCISAVQIYFPCEPTTTATNYTSLCEQYTWRVACYDNHASTPSSHPDRATAEIEMIEHCRAAGSIGAAIVQRRYHAERRQINSILSSIGGEITSFLSSASITIVLPTFASNTPATSAEPSPALTTSASQQSTLQSVVSTPAPSRSLTSSEATNTRSDLAESTSSAAAAASSSSKKSGPSPGLIAGAVIGSVAVLVLLGILLMLILRHKRRKSSTKTSAAEHGLSNDVAAVPPYRGEPSVETITTTHNGASVNGGDDEKSVFQRRESHIVSPLTPTPQHALPLHPVGGSEMPTSANVWELEGRERPRPAELEAENAYIPYRGEHGHGGMGEKR